jgi:hypothetical protein
MSEILRCASSSLPSPFSSGLLLHHCAPAVGEERDDVGGGEAVLEQLRLRAARAGGDLATRRSLGPVQVQHVVPVQRAVPYQARVVSVALLGRVLWYRPGLCHCRFRMG